MSTPHWLYVWYKLFNLLGSRPISTVVSTFRHPAFTPETRLFNGDRVGRLLVEMASLKRFGVKPKHYNLIWESHRPGSETEVQVSWNLLGLLEQPSLSIDSGSRLIEWWGNAQGPVEKILDRSFWERVEISLRAGLRGRVSLTQISQVEARLWEVHRVYRDHLQTGGPTSLATFRLYRSLVKLVLGKPPSVEAVPYMQAAPKLVGSLLERMPEEVVCRELGSLIGVDDHGRAKFLFMGSSGDHPGQLQYVGWSPVGRYFEVTRMWPATGKSVGKSRRIGFNEVVSEVLGGRMMPIGVMAALLIEGNPRFLHHGASRGQRDLVAKVRGSSSLASSVSEPHDSWPILVVQHEGRSVALGFHELYVVLGPRNSLVLRCAQGSYWKGSPVEVPLSVLLQNIP